MLRFLRKILNIPFVILFILTKLITSCIWCLRSKIPYFNRKNGSNMKFEHNMWSQSGPANGLCANCNLNQQKKVRRLAEFIPLREENYDQEVEQFQKSLNKKYRLCRRCDVVLKEKLNCQNMTIFVHLQKSVYVEANRLSVTRTQVINTLYMGSLWCVISSLFLGIFGIFRNMIVAEYLNIQSGGLGLKTSILLWIIGQIIILFGTHLMVNLNSQVEAFHSLNAAQATREAIVEAMRKQIVRTHPMATRGLAQGDRRF